MANLNENDAIDRVKRGSLNFKVTVEKNIGDAEKNFTMTLIQKLDRDIKDVHRNNGLATTLKNALKKQYGGKWLVIGCEKDEFCSFDQLDLNIHEELRVYYGKAFWGVFKV